MLMKPTQQAHPLHQSITGSGLQVLIDLLTKAFSSHIRNCEVLQIVVMLPMGADAK
jgi:hypothetical protein